MLPLPPVPPALLFYTSSQACKNTSYIQRAHTWARVRVGWSCSIFLVVLAFLLLFALLGCGRCLMEGTLQCILGSFLALARKSGVPCSSMRARGEFSLRELLHYLPRRCVHDDEMRVALEDGSMCKNERRETCRRDDGDGARVGPHNKPSETQHVCTLQRK